MPVGAQQIGLKVIMYRVHYQSNSRTTNQNAHMIVCRSVPALNMLFELHAQDKEGQVFSAIIALSCKQTIVIITKQRCLKTKTSRLYDS